MTGRRMARADAHDLRDFVGRVRKADDVGARGRVVRLAAAVMLADGVAVDRARAELLFELGNRLLRSTKQ